MKFVIPTGRNNKTYSTIAHAGAYKISFPTFLDMVRGFGREIYEVNDNWNGTLGELRHPLINRITKYFSRK